MKRLLIAILVATLGYSGWWFYAANATKSSVEDWFADLREKGWQADYADLTVKGFPNRTDLTLTAPRLATPTGEVAWTAPFFQMLALSYKRGHVIVAWPNEQTVTLPEGVLNITSDGLRASLISDGDLILRGNLEAPILNMTTGDKAFALAGVNVALQKSEGAGADYRLAATIDSLAHSNPALSGTAVPDAFASFRIDKTLSLSVPLTKQNLPDAPPNLKALEIRTAQLSYGAFTFKLTGNAQFDATGRANGDATVEAQNWQGALQAAQDNGALPPELAQAAMEFLGFLASSGGAQDKLDIKFRFLDGRVMFGPIPIATLPNIRW